MGKVGEEEQVTPMKVQSLGAGGSSLEFADCRDCREQCVEIGERQGSGELTRS